MSLYPDSNFEQVIKKGIYIVKFASLWNMESRAFEQQFKELSEEFKGKANFINSDVNANQILAKKENINTVPTIVIYVNGVAVKQLTGMTKRSLKEIIDFFIKKYGSP